MSSSQGEVLGLQQMKSQSKSNISVYWKSLYVIWFPKRGASTWRSEKEFEDSQRAWEGSVT